MIDYGLIRLSLEKQHRLWSSLTTMAMLLSRVTSPTNYRSDGHPNSSPCQSQAPDQTRDQIWETAQSQDLAERSAGIISISVETDARITMKNMVRPPWKTTWSTRYVDWSVLKKSSVSWALSHVWRQHNAIWYNYSSLNSSMIFSISPWKK